MKTIIQCVEDGKIVLLESVGQELDASLDPLLSQQTITKGSQKYIRLGPGSYSLILIFLAVSFYHIFGYVGGYAHLKFTRGRRCHLQRQVPPSAPDKIA